MPTTLRTFLSNRPAWHFISAGLLTLAMVFSIDVSTDKDLFLSQFYTMTVVIVAWGAGWRWGALMSVLTTTAWLYALQVQDGPHHKFG